MKSMNTIAKVASMALCAVVIVASGCRGGKSARWFYQSPPPPMMLGAQSDEIWMKQEVNAEASDFVLYQHEFEKDGARLNMGGEDHLKQIAGRLLEGHDFPVIIERSMTTERENTEYHYPVHPNPELDMQRHEVVVRLLTAMGVPEVELRVVVSPALTAGFKATESESDYVNSLSGQGSGDGFGSFGGFGGMGGYGGFGY